MYRETVGLSLKQAVNWYKYRFPLFYNAVDRMRKNKGHDACLGHQPPSLKAEMPAAGYSSAMSSTASPRMPTMRARGMLW